ncbi:hypothetical protein [Macrococcus sp. DPC7161]|uniref:hypothetical protein n=1 Tax=Macrococcus sp. DPC7161 TaxID=2507060 RepID=UPI0013E962C5|nr:hypothetical protein [Macrococcus sp. DPC7161]
MNLTNSKVHTMDKGKAKAGKVSEKLVSTNKAVPKMKEPPSPADLGRKAQVK